MPADRQAKSCSAIFAGGRPVSLGKVLENPFLGFRRDTDAGIGNFQRHIDGLVILRGDGEAQHDPAVLGELDGIAQQIGHDLAQAEGIAAYHQAIAGRPFGHQGQPLLASWLREHLERLLKKEAQIKIGRFQFEIAGFDLGKIEDVIDDAQQMLAGALDSFDKLALGRIEARTAEQFGHAEHAVHRSPDFVTHRRQKLALGTAAGLRGLLGKAQFARALLDTLFQIAQMRSQPVVAFANLLDHVVEAIGQLVYFADTAGRRLAIEMSDGNLGHVSGQLLHGLDQPTHLACLQTPDDDNGNRHFEQDQGQIGEQLQIGRSQCKAQAQPAR